MIKKLSKLNPNKACGPDDIHPHMIKELRNEIALPLKILFDKTMTEGKIPQDWKQAIVKPIFKKGDKHSASNYRPVSLTSVVSKLFESFIRDSISLHMRNENILSDHQNALNRKVGHIQTKSYLEKKKKSSEKGELDK